MARAKDSGQLAEYERRYRELAGQLANVGLIYSGSIARRYTRCGTPGCKCHADPPQLHGPYYQWTAKENGKTVTRRLSPAEAELYKEWIDNDRQLRRILQQMRQLAVKAAQLKLEQASKP
jgi:hypothetical protein